MIIENSLELISRPTAATLALTKGFKMQVVLQLGRADMFG